MSCRQAATILATNMTAADEGKKMVRFFQLRRGFFASVGNLSAMQTSATQARNWLSAYDSARRPTPESMATKFYLALNLQIQGEAASPIPKMAKASALACHGVKASTSRPGAVQRRTDSARIVP